MTKRITKSNVVLFPKRQIAGDTDEERLQLAQEKVYDAWESAGKRRTNLAREALKLSADCVDAYLLLAQDLTDLEKRIKLFRQAVEAGGRVLGEGWEEKYRGLCWGELETRPIMRAMGLLAKDLRWNDQLQEALILYRKMIELNPSDNQGVRYDLIGCLFEARCDLELEKVFDEWKTDPTATMAYTKALYLFRKYGSSKRSIKALQFALKRNYYVPIFLSDVIDMPDEPPSRIGFGDTSEAVAYVFDNCYLWWDTQGATKWLADTVGDDLMKLIDDKELVEYALEELRGEHDD